MTSSLRTVAVVSAVMWVWLVSAVAGQQAPGGPPAGTDLRTQPTLYVVPYAHLDTQW